MRRDIPQKGPILCNRTLSTLPESIAIPSYDRTRLSPGIVHIGVGNFHRAHQSWYLHRLMEMGLGQDWAIIGAGVRSGDAVQREKLLAQDCLTTLIEPQRIMHIYWISINWQLKQNNNKKL